MRYWPLSGVATSSRRCHRDGHSVPGRNSLALQATQLLPEIHKRTQVDHWTHRGQLSQNSSQLCNLYPHNEEPSPHYGNNLLVSLIWGSFIQAALETKEYTRHISLSNSTISLFFHFEQFFSINIIINRSLVLTTGSWLHSTFLLLRCIQYNRVVYISWWIFWTKLLMTF